MINKDLTDFIKQQLQKGINKEVISKELLVGDWTLEDIEEGFKSIDILSQIPAPNPTPVYSSISSPIPTLASSPTPLDTQFPAVDPNFKPVKTFSSSFSSDFHKTSNRITSPTGSSNHVIRNVILTVLGLLLLAGIAFSFIFRNDLPVVKDLIKSEVIPEVVVSQDKNTQNSEVLPSTSTDQKPEIVVDQANQDEAVFAGMNNAIIDVNKNAPAPAEVLDCKNNINCFIRAANICLKSKVEITQTDKYEPAMVGAISDGTYFYEITGKENDNCIAGIKVSNYKLKPTEKLPEASLAMMADYSKMKEETTIICNLSLSKKMGDILNTEVIDPKDNFIENTDSSFSTNSGSVNTNTYKSGMICIEKVPVTVKINN